MRNILIKHKKHNDVKHNDIKHNDVKPLTVNMLRLSRYLTDLEIILSVINMIILYQSRFLFLMCFSFCYFVTTAVKRIIYIRIPLNVRFETEAISDNRMYKRCINAMVATASVTLLAFLYSITLFFTIDEVTWNYYTLVGAILNGTLIFIEVYELIRIHKYRGLLIDSCRVMIIVKILCLFAGVVGISMLYSHDKDKSTLMALTGVVLSLLAVAVIVYYWQKLVLGMEHNQKKYQYFKQNKTVWVTRISIRKDIILVLGKLMFSIFTVSFFLFVNALYTAGMGVARFIALYYSKKEWKEQIRGYFLIGIGILVGGSSYVIYSLRLFFNEKTTTYPMVVALIIAMYTFWELFVVIKNYIKARMINDILSEELKLIGLSSTLICLVLTQVAIMSFSYDGDASFYNGLSGIVFGSLSALVGVYMMIRAVLWKKREA